jgi:hypothetical protein
MTQTVTAIPTTVHKAAGWIAQGNEIMCKKHKLNVSVNGNTYPCSNKVIQQNKIELNNKINLKKKEENKSKESCNNKLSLIILMC